MSKPIELLAKLQVGADVAGNADFTILIGASTEAAPTQEGYKILARIPATSIAEAGVLEKTIEVDGETPTWLAAAVESKFHGEAAPFGDPDYMPRIPPGSGISLTVLRLSSKK